jgi:hypothetical protein
MFSIEQPRRRGRPISANYRGAAHVSGGEDKRALYGPVNVMGEHDRVGQRPLRRRGFSKPSLNPRLVSARLREAAWIASAV